MVQLSAQCQHNSSQNSYTVPAEKTEPTPTALVQVLADISVQLLGIRTPLLEQSATTDSNQRENKELLK